MKIISMHILKWNENEPVFLTSQFELGFINFIKRPFFKETLIFGVRTATARVKKGERTAVTLDDAKANCCIWVDGNNTACVIVADDEYPQKVCFTIIGEMFREFYKNYNQMQIDTITKDADLKLDKMQLMIKNYQDPKEADKLAKLESTLNEVTEICHKTLNDLMRRGENLEILMQKSKDMSTVSQDFYKKAKKANTRCCILI